MTRSQAKNTPPRSGVDTPPYSAILPGRSSVAPQARPPPPFLADPIPLRDPEMHTLRTRGSVRFVQGAPEAMNFDFSDEQKLLQQTARDYLEANSPLATCHF